MQAPPSQPFRLHWIPVEPSWLIAGGLVLLGSLPHQVPAAGRRMLSTSVGALLFAVLAAWVTWKIPVLGAAMFIFLAGVSLAGPQKEGFSGRAQVLNKDKVTEKKRWLVEDIMSEEPAAIQERTEGPALTFDEVDHPHEKWEVEHALEENPLGIQERPIAELPEYDDSHPPYRS